MASSLDPENAQIELLRAKIYWRTKNYSHAVGAAAVRPTTRALTPALARRPPPPPSPLR